MRTSISSSALRRSFFFQPVALALVYVLAVPFTELQAQSTIQTTQFTPNYPANSTSGTPATSILAPLQTVQTVSGTLTLTLPVIPASSQGSLLVSSIPPLVAPVQPGNCTPDKKASEIIQCNTFGYGSVGTFEQTSVDMYLIAHGLPVSDAQYIYQYGRQDLRDDIRAYIFTSLLQIIQKAAADRSPSETALFNWLTALVSSRQIAEYKAANDNYQLFLSNTGSGINGTNCPFSMDATISNAIGLDPSTYQTCVVHTGIPLPSTFLRTPPLSYFTAYGHAQAFDYQLGTTGSVSLNRVQRLAPGASFLIAQNPASSTAEQAALYSSAAAASSGIAAAVGANFVSIAPYRFTPGLAQLLIEEFQRQLVRQTSLAQCCRQPGEKFTRPNASTETTASETAATSSEESAATAAGEEASAEADAIADAISAATGTSAVIGLAGGVLAIVLVALEIAVNTGQQVTAETQNESDDATIPTLYNNALTTVPDLTQLITTAQGYSDIASAFVLATYPDFPSTAPLPSPTTTQNFAFTTGRYATAGSIAYEGSDGTTWNATLWNGWLLQNHTVNGVYIDSFGLNMEYTDPAGTAYRATRVQPTLFEVEKINYTPTDNFCFIDPALGITNPQTYNLSQCASAITEQVNLVNNGYTASTLIAQPPQITSPSVITYAEGSTFSFQPTYTKSSDPLNLVPCGISYSGVPNFVTENNNYTLTGNPVFTGSGIYSGLMSTVNCGGESTTQAETINYGTAILFNSNGTFSLQQGTPFSAIVSTSSTPVASLSASNLPAGVTFKDNGNGTGTLSGTLSKAGPCFAGGPCPQITAQSAVATATQTLFFLLTATTPSFLAPVAGQTLEFVNGVDSSPANTYTVKTVNGSGVHLVVTSGLQNISATFTDNGDGTGTFTYNHPQIVSDESGTLTLTATECCGLPAVSENINWFARIPTPAIDSIAQGPLAYFVGQYYDANGPTIILGATSTGITLGAALPAGLTATNGACASPSGTFNTPCVYITGTPTVPGLYHIPATITGPNQEYVGRASLDFAVYSPPTFPVYNYSNLVVFRNGYKGTQKIGPETGFPIAPFSSNLLGIGASSGISYSLGQGGSAYTASGAFALNAGVGGTPNGTVSLLYNGTSVLGTSDANFTLPLVATVTTGPVYGPLAANGKTDGFAQGNLTYTDQSVLDIRVVVARMGDANLDGKVDCSDVARVESTFGQTKSSSSYQSLYDMNSDGVINLQDVLLVTQNLPAGTTCH